MAEDLPSLLIGCVSHGAVGRLAWNAASVSERLTTPNLNVRFSPGLSVCYYQPRLYLLLKVPPDSSHFALHCRSGFTPPYTYRTKPLASRLVASWLAAEPNAKTERQARAGRNSESQRSKSDITKKKKKNFLLQSDITAEL